LVASKDGGASCRTLDAFYGVFRGLQSRCLHGLCARQRFDVLRDEAFSEGIAPRLIVRALHVYFVPLYQECTSAVLV